MIASGTTLDKIFEIARSLNSSVSSTWEQEHERARKGSQVIDDHGDIRQEYGD